MLNTREKLIELFFNAEQMVAIPYMMNTEQAKRYIFEKMADHLITNGVTVQEWISVKDRLPEEPLQTVLVTNGKETCVAVYSIVYDEFGVMCGRGRGSDKRFGVTFWMPLPQPPNGQ